MGQWQQKTKTDPYWLAKCAARAWGVCEDREREVKPCMAGVWFDGVDARGCPSRSNALFWLATHWRELGLSEEKALQLVLKCNGRFRPPHAPGAVKGQVHRAYTAKRKDGKLWRVTCWTLREWPHCPNVFQEVSVNGHKRLDLVSVERCLAHDTRSARELVDVSGFDYSDRDFQRLGWERCLTRKGTELYRVLSGVAQLRAIPPDGKLYVSFRELSEVVGYARGHIHDLLDELAYHRLVKVHYGLPGQGRRQATAVQKLLPPPTPPTRKGDTDGGHRRGTREKGTQTGTQDTGVFKRSL